MSNPIIVALDVATTREALELVRQIGVAAGPYKGGMELNAAGGPAFVRAQLARGHRVFLNMRFYDIPETVKRATAQVARPGVSLLPIHGSVSAMKAAVEGKAGPDLKLLAVTVLTSFDESDMAELGCTGSIGDLVAMRTRKAKVAGVEGIVCSPLEVRVRGRSCVRRQCWRHRACGRPELRWAIRSGVATPRQAMDNGAMYLVIGRQITRAADPAGEARRMLEEIGRT